MEDRTEIEATAERAMLSGHPALELLNTVSRVEGELVDSMQSDVDVAWWLARVGHPLPRNQTSFEASALLDTARKLRDTIRTALELRKAGKRINAASLNRFLQKAPSRLKLVTPKTGEVDLVREWLLDTPEGVFGPIAEAAAELLTGDLGLVKRCESSECVLWFVDRTKSHHRRWCSTSTCGNRHKVAAFRRRQQDGSQ